MVVEAVVVVVTGVVVEMCSLSGSRRCMAVFSACFFSWAARELGFRGLC